MDTNLAHMTSGISPNKPTDCRSEGEKRPVNEAKAGRKMPVRSHPGDQRNIMKLPPVQNLVTIAVCNKRVLFCPNESPDSIPLNVLQGFMVKELRELQMLGFAYLSLLRQALSHEKPSIRGPEIRMNRIQVSLLGALLCFVALSLSSDETTKSGECPPERFYNTRAFENQPIQCANDSGCPGKQKCCKDNKAYLCKPPAEVRNGTCPTKQPENGIYNRSKDGCRSDRECTPGSKCCLEDCRWKCTPAVGEMNDTCPIQPYKDCNDGCRSDSECAPGAKCCFEDYRWKCMPSVGVKKGFCRIEVKETFCFVPERPTCENDTACSEDYKCCQTMCGMTCQKPLEERSGTCPPPVTSDNTTQKTDLCNSDYDCKAPAKCCETGSGKNCTIPLKDDTTDI
ncbi:uncharacterized protein LOC142210085 [Leptodactylus fuscus]|uniref:uncharacterized protein LOC142210085 n=1 Tax=Leptodactylus fuscus TaxID=238119 RepID=UPI003F4E95F9